MKSIPFLILLGVAITGTSQTSFRAALNTSPSSEITGAAGFTLDGSTARFTISINRERIVPASAQLIGPRATLTFGLGNPFVIVHSPGPWPNGYDGSTAFFGPFDLPPDLQSDFRAGLTILELRTSEVGDLRGQVLPDPGPQLTTLGKQGAELRLGFVAQPPYRYTVEVSSDLGMSSASSLTNVSALSQTFSVVVTEPITATGERFYRIRRVLCCGE